MLGVVVRGDDNDNDASFSFMIRSSVVVAQTQTIMLCKRV
jgi:hypothetical protein